MFDLIVQPTQGCNLNCRYCYLPNRSSHIRMSVEVATALSESIELSQEAAHIIWHAGEPLTCGLDHLQQLFTPFEGLRAKRRITHSLQTNGTLISHDWCLFFKSFGIQIGVSIDGPRKININRLTWSGHETFSKAIRGTRLLNASSIPFNVIAVILADSLPKARELYEFFLTLGCESVGVNIVEQEGVNKSASPDDDRVKLFWSELFNCWRTNPKIRVREFSHAFAWMEAVVRQAPTLTNSEINLLPTITTSGDVILLSPELAGISSHPHKDFVVGNVTEESLGDILGRAFQVPYVEEYVRGVQACREKCEYFSFCRGGHASNKYFERDSFAVTETAYCRNAKIRLIEGILCNL